MDADPAAAAPVRTAGGAALTALAVAALLLLAVMVALRIGYPFELEWMEGAMVDEASRVRQGLASYHAPTVEHVPFLYTPLLYWLGAAAMSLFGETFAALRAVGVAAAALCLWLVFTLARQESGSRRAGLWAAGLLAMGYGWLRSWFDLGRNDMLFLAAMLSCWLLVRRGTPRAAAAAGAVAVAAFLAKQTAVLWLPWLVLAALVRDRRLGLLFAGVAGLGIGAAILLLDGATDGWFGFYVFTMPRAHAVQEDRIAGFFTEDLVPVLPALGAAAGAIALQWRGGRPGERAAAVSTTIAVLGGLCASYASRLHVGGFDNALAYGFAALVVVAAAPAVTAPTASLRRLFTALLLLQFALLAVDVRSLWQARPTLLYDPRTWLPRTVHRHAQEQLLEFTRVQAGPVWLVFHGHLAPMAGKPAAAHGQALQDLLGYVLQPGLAADDRAAMALQQSAQEALGARRFAAIVLEQPYGASFEGVFGPLLGGYERRPGSLIDDAAAVRPTVGMVLDTPYALVPRR